jgi:hypothetical protein
MDKILRFIICIKHRKASDEVGSRKEASIQSEQQSGTSRTLARQLITARRRAVMVKKEK